MLRNATGTQKTASELPDAIHNFKAILIAILNALWRHAIGTTAIVAIVPSAVGMTCCLTINAKQNAITLSVTTMERRVSVLLAVLLNIKAILHATKNALWRHAIGITDIVAIARWAVGTQC